MTTCALACLYLGNVSDGRGERWVGLSHTLELLVKRADSLFTALEFSALKPFALACQRVGLHSDCFAAPT